jgi:SAM-dependent methyltransferase
MSEQGALDVVAVDGYNRRLWGRLADAYVDAVEGLTVRATEPLLDAAGVGRGTQLLDVGTGPGTVLGPALARGAIPRAVDLAPEMVEVARARFPLVDVTVANATQLPFDDGAFDAVTLAFSLHHMAEPSAALREVHRVLRPGGRIAMTVWAPDELLEGFGVGLAPLGELGIEAEAPLEGPLVYATGAAFLELLDEAGFVQPALRQLDTVWRVRDGRPVAALFSRYLDLGSQPGDVLERYAAAVDRCVHARLGPDGWAALPNPALLALAQRPA